MVADLTFGKGTGSIANSLTLLIRVSTLWPYGVIILTGACFIIDDRSMAYLFIELKVSIVFALKIKGAFITPSQPYQIILM